MVEIQESSQPSRRWLPRLVERIVGAIAPTVLVFLALELVLRLGLFVWHDFSQYYLFYGFHTLVGRVGVSPWSVYSGDHYKFPPNYTLHGAAGQGGETAATNSLGFRGPDFEPEKAKNSYRILTLGGSSTFGFHNADDETYPFLLQQRFREPVHGQQVEVINAGFPYYTSASIRSLLESELFDYHPDLVTLYTAYNDASWPLQLNAATRLVFWLQQHSAIYLALKESLLTDLRVYKIRQKIRRLHPVEFDEAALEEMEEAVARRYRRNIEAIITMATERGVRIVLIRQPMTTRQHNKTFAGLAYEDEYQAVRKKIGNREFLSAFDIRMILHHRLVDELDAIAREQGLPIIDNIGIVDEDRSRLTTHVHLTAEANDRLAAELYSVLLPTISAAASAQPEPPLDATAALE